MATATQLIPIEEYLRTSYHPDCDYVDGEIQERNLGEFEHGRLQALLTMWFGNNEKQWNVRVVTELRTRVASTKVRIPDVCLISRDAPREQVPVTPPVLCIEILSPEDRLTRVVKRMDDFLAMGVQNLWIISPQDRTAWTYSAKGLLKLTTDRLTIQNTPIYVDLPTLFASLD
jgi:Uma2 family endonuclease